MRTTAAGGRHEDILSRTGLPLGRPVARMTVLTLDNTPQKTVPPAATGHKMVGVFLLSVKLKILTGFLRRYMIRSNDNPTRRCATEQRVKIAGIQFAVTETVERSVARAKELLALSHEQGAQLVSFSELFVNPWFPCRPKADPAPFAETVPGPLTDEFCRLADEYTVVIVLPLCERKGSRYYNTAAVIDADGTLLGAYRKVHVPQIPLWHEKDCFTPGDGGFPVFKTRYLTIGVQICWDNFFPEGSRALGLAGAELIVAPTAAAMMEFLKSKN